MGQKANDLLVTGANGDKLKKSQRRPNEVLKVLVIDIGGTHVKVYTANVIEPKKIDSGPKLTPKKLVKAVLSVTNDTPYDVVSIGYPGPVVHGKPANNPHNLGTGWLGFDFEKYFRRPVQIINDAAMQALGSYRGGRMLFLGLGTGLGAAMIVEGVLEPMELAHLQYQRGKTFEETIGAAALKRLGTKNWTRKVFDVVKELQNALEPDYVVLGGGNAKLLKKLPPNTIRGNNENAREGGLHLWSSNRQRRISAGGPHAPKEREIQIVANVPALARAAAKVFVASAKEAVAERGRFTVVLSGGSTPKALYSLLSTEPELRSQVPWEKTYCFFGDERHVPPSHEESNYRMAKEALLSKAPLKPAHVFRIRGELRDPDRSATQYASALRDFFKIKHGQLPLFDLVLLGMGSEGHTASLFPGTSALFEWERLVTSSWVAKLYTHRITMTAPVLSSAKLVMFLVQGSEKSLALKAALEGPYEPQQLPTQLIAPSDGRLLWLVDESAAALLDRRSLKTREKRKP